MYSSSRLVRPLNTSQPGDLPRVSYDIVTTSTMKIREYNPDKPGYGRRLTDQEWLEFKPILTALNDKGISRRQIIATAADEHGFEGTYAAMNIRFKEWGLTQPKAQQEVIFEYEPALDVDASESPATPSIPYVSSAEGSLESTNGSTFSTSNVLVPSLPESLEFWSSDSNLSSRRKEPDQQLVQLMQCSSRPRNGHTLVQMELISKSSIEPSILRQLVQAQVWRSLLRHIPRKSMHCSHLLDYRHARL